MDDTMADVGIVGAGPIGLETAIALKKAGFRRILHFDAKQIGYTISWFPPQTRFFSSNERIAIADVPLQTPDQLKATREEYLAYLRSIVQLFDLDVRTYEPVIGIDRIGPRFKLTTHPAAGLRTYTVDKLILATGGTDRPRRLNVPGEDLPHVSHYFQDPHSYFRRRLLIVGGRNSAVEAALRCHHAGANVALSYRRDRIDGGRIKYWLLPEISGLMDARRIEGHLGTVPVEIAADHVVLRRLNGGETYSVPVDFVLLLTGYEADMSLCKLAGVELTGPCLTPLYEATTMETNVPGLFVAGTAVGGTQEKYTVFIENCHVHVKRIVAALTGSDAPQETAAFARPES